MRRLPRLGSGHVLNPMAQMKAHHGDLHIRAADDITRMFSYHRGDIDRRSMG